MHKLIIGLAALIYSGAAIAGSATGKIATVLVADGAAAVLFTLTSELSDTPRCNEARRFSIDLRKPGGVAAYMAILEAKRQGYIVSVEGLNTCTNEWKSEDIKNVVLH